MKPNKESEEIIEVELPESIYQQLHLRSEELNINPASLMAQLLDDHLKDVD